MHFIPASPCLNGRRMPRPTFAARTLDLVCKRAEGALHGMGGAGQLLKGFRAHSTAPSTGGNLALQR